MSAVITALMAFILSACGGTQPKNDTRASADRGNNLMHPDLLGTWTFDCAIPHTNNPTGTIVAYTGEFQVTKDQVIYTQTGFYETECKTASFRILQTYSYAPKGPLAGSSDAYKWDWKVISHFQTALDEEEVRLANDIKAYDYSDWKINTPKSILGRKRTSTQQAADIAGVMSYMIYKIENGVGYFKSSDAINDGKSDTRRKIGLDPRLPLKKKTSAK
jgi:hypothetical protein